MPEFLAPSSRNPSTLQRWQNFKHIGGCMGAFSQMFQLNRMLGGSNTHLPTKDAASLPSGSNTTCGAFEKQSSLRGEQTQGADIGIDLRRVLDVKQEPFVLQEIIWEKKHPARTRSSRELKFEMNDKATSARRQQRSKRERSKDLRNISDAGIDGNLSSPSLRSGGTSFALVKGNNIPAESMVTLPSPGASPLVRKFCSSSFSSKASSSGKNSMKSPNKRALLMEAATKILEGSNRRASKVLSSSAQTSLRDLNESKQSPASLKSKESLGAQSFIKQKSPLQNVTTLEQKPVESKQNFLGKISTSSNIATQLRQDPSNQSFEMSDAEVLMIMQSRVYPSDEMSAVRGQFSQPATTVHSHSRFGAPQQFNQVEGPNTEFSKVDQTQEGRLIPPALVATSNNRQRFVDLRPVDKWTYRDVGFVMESEISGRNQRQPVRDASVDRSKDLELAPVADSSNMVFTNELPVPEFANLLVLDSPQKPSQVKDLHECLLSTEVTIDDIDYSINAAMSQKCEERIEDIDCVHTHPLLGTNGHVKPCINSDNKTGISKEITSEKVHSIENAPPSVLLLCNYSWWTQEEIRSNSSTFTNETLNECVEYDSPTVTTKGPHAVKIFEGSKGDENLEEDSSPTSEHSYADEFQQSSPVSVLDAVYDDGPILGKPFDYFDETRQKLLESVRRYEMLAHLDLDALTKLNEESLCHVFDEEESDTSSFKESWGSDAADNYQAPIMGSPDYQSSSYGGFSDVDMKGFCLDSAHGHEAIDEDFYIHSDEDLYMRQLQELANEDVGNASDFIMDVRSRFKAEFDLFDCSSEPSDLHASEGLRQQSMQSNSSRDTLDEVEMLAGLVVINEILHMDMTTSSWSSFPEEVEVMEMELESSLFAALMQELLSELLC